MNLTYQITATGYTILNDGIPWIVQETYIPYEGATMEESAQNHINTILENREDVANEKSDLILLNEQVATQEQALAETNATLLEFMESSILP